MRVNTSKENGEGGFPDDVDVFDGVNVVAQLMKNFLI